MEPNFSNPTPSTPPEPSAGEIARRLGPAGVLGLIWTTAPLILGFTLLARANVVGTWLRDLGPNGPLVYGAAFALMTGFGLLPTYASALLGGWAFGLQTALPAALAGCVGGGVIGYAIARGASGDRVEALIREQPTWRAVRDALVGGSFLKTLGIVTLLRLPPNSPFALTNLVLASVRVRWAPFVLGTLFGIAPRTFAAVWLAAAVRDLTAAEATKATTPKWVIVAGIVATIVVIAVVGMIAKAALRRVTGGLQKAAAGTGES